MQFSTSLSIVLHTQRGCSHLCKLLIVFHLAVVAIEDLEDNISYFELSSLLWREVKRADNLSVCFLCNRCSGYTKLILFRGIIQAGGVFLAYYQSATMNTDVTMYAFIDYSRHILNFLITKHRIPTAIALLHLLLKLYSLDNLHEPPYALC